MATSGLFTPPRIGTFELSNRLNAGGAPEAVLRPLRVGVIGDALAPRYINAAILDAVEVAYAAAGDDAVGHQA
jgi:hypothetical protein